MPLKFIQHFFSFFFVEGKDGWNLKGNPSFEFKGERGPSDIQKSFVLSIKKKRHWERVRRNVDSPLFNYIISKLERTRNNIGSGNPIRREESFYWLGG